MDYEGNQSVSFEYLPEWFCQVIDLQKEKTCSEFDPNACIICEMLGSFFTGEKLWEVTSFGHIVCLLMWIVVVVIGAFGVVANILIMVSIWRMNTSRPFDILIMILAGYDMLCCASSFVGTTVHVALYQSWISKGFLTMHLFHKFTILTLLWRTASTYMAILITLERFLVLTYPFQTKKWFTSRSTLWLAFGVGILSIIVNIPRFLIFQVQPNNYLGIRSLDDFSYLIGYITVISRKSKMIGDFFDFIAPLPILLIFNVLSYIKVQKRQTNAAQKAEIEALKLFLPVVIAYFSTNVIPFVHFFVARSTKVYYRELNIGIGLCAVINSAVNFPIYCYQRPVFRKEAKSVIMKWYRLLLCTNEGKGEMALHESNASNSAESGSTNL
ncbi:unnamed protein product [Orchesella dallaii]|uniref:G-protein coupled receptors family 1 profile domain-containing protein n=1 Tax=Orchesella dallaii TaxID=48710 RepID=A0ABP1R003_9HEXA